MNLLFLVRTIKKNQKLSICSQIKIIRYKNVFKK